LNRDALISRPLCCQATATARTYTLSLHDALPISGCFAAVSDVPVHEDQVAAEAADLAEDGGRRGARGLRGTSRAPGAGVHASYRSEEHTSELQSRGHLVCRLLLEKKKTIHTNSST